MWVSFSLEKMGELMNQVRNDQRTIPIDFKEVVEFFSRYTLQNIPDIFYSNPGVKFHLLTESFVILFSKLFSY